MATRRRMRLSQVVPFVLLAILHSSCMSVPATHRSAAMSGRVVAADGTTPVGGVLLLYSCTQAVNVADASSERTVRLSSTFSSADGSFCFPAQRFRYSRPVGMLSSSEFGWDLYVCDMDSEGAFLWGRPRDYRNGLVVRLRGVDAKEPHAPCHGVASALDSIRKFGAVSPSDPHYPDLKRLEGRVIDYVRSHPDAGIDYAEERF